VRGAAHKTVTAVVHSKSFETLLRLLLSNSWSFNPSHRSFSKHFGLLALRNWRYAFSEAANSLLVTSQPLEKVALL
jgi:hypothetical protein